MACYGCINPNNACAECKRNMPSKQMIRTYRLIQLPGGIITDEWEGRPLPLNAIVLETGLTITEAMDKSRHHRRQRELNKAFSAE